MQRVIANCLSEKNLKESLNHIVNTCIQTDRWVYRYMDITPLLSVFCLDKHLTNTTDHKKYHADVLGHHYNANRTDTFYNHDSQVL